MLLNLSKILNICVDTKLNYSFHSFNLVGRCCRFAAPTQNTTSHYVRFWRKEIFGEGTINLLVV